VKTKLPHLFRLAVVAFAIFCQTGTARADEFALSVSPPRFELAAKPGQTVRAVAELSNRSDARVDLKFATADWELTADGGVILSEALKPDSCRRWVAIERRQTVLPGKTSLRYRFEVTPPADTPPTECRFAIVVAGGDSNVEPAADVKFPVSGQIALIVYVAVGDVKPSLRIVKAAVVEIGGVKTPVVMVENTGEAHGRLSAFLNGTDAAGVKREFSPSTLPILPGETRMITLNPDDGENSLELEAEELATSKSAGPIVFPVTITGTMNDSMSSFQFEGVFEP
jgi:hypothetical protein